MVKKVLFQRLGILLAYPLAYAYVRLLMGFSEEFYIEATVGAGEFHYNIAYPIFAILFIIVNEIVRRGRRGALENPTTATCYNMIGQVYHGQGYYAEAFNMCFKALRIREKVFGSNHTELADSCNALGLLYFSQEFFQEAKEYFSKAVDIYGKDENNVHPDFATIYVNMALIAYNEADLDTSLAYD